MFFVRSASEQDMAAVSTLLGETWHATYDALYGAERVAAITADWYSPAALKRQLARPEGEFLVADDGRRLGGMAFAAPVKGDAETVQLHQLYVRPDCQRMGVGRDLFAEIETCFPDAKRMRLEVEPQNASAIAFYEAHGFVETGRTQNCGAEDSAIPALIYEKTLG